MAASNTAPGGTLNRHLNRLQNAIANDAAAIGTAATADRFLIFDASDDPNTFEAKYAVGTDLLVAAGVTSSPTELNQLTNTAVVMTKGAGVSAMETYANGAFKNGTLIVTRIVIDLTGLVGSATDVDIIGNTGGAASAHIGRVTTAINGTMVGGCVTCLEVPAGGAADIDFYSATESTGAQDALVTGLTETALVTAGGNWTSGAVKGMTAVPAANEYLYVCNGAASGGTFTAGKFLIELFGV